MQAALCNTRVFTARTQSRSASRRSVRVQAADRTLWLPGKGRQGPVPPHPAHPSSPAALHVLGCPPPPSTNVGWRIRSGDGPPAALQSCRARRRSPPTHAARALPAPACLQASRPLSTWTASLLAVRTQGRAAGRLKHQPKLCSQQERARFRCRRPICKLTSHFALSLLADYGFGEPELVILDRCVACSGSSGTGPRMALVGSRARAAGRRRRLGAAADPAGSAGVQHGPTEQLLDAQRPGCCTTPAPSYTAGLAQPLVTSWIVCSSHCC